MKKIRLAAILAAAVILMFAGCSAMNNTTENIGLDLSGVLAKTVSTDVNYVKVWLVAEGSSNFIELEQSGFEISTSNSVITLDNIPVGPTYTIYLTLGVKSGDNFTPRQTAKGTVSVAGGVDNRKTLTASNVATTGNTLAGVNITGVVPVGADIYAVSSNKLYKNGTLAYSAPAGSTFNDLDLGINGDLFISADASDGKAIIRYDGAGDPDFSAGLAAAAGGEVDILSSEVFCTDTDGADNDFQVILSQLEAGLVIHVYIEDPVPADVSSEWIYIDLEEFLAAAGEAASSINLSGGIIRDLVVFESGTDMASIFLASKVGNFRKDIATDGSAVSEDFGTDFISGTSLSDRLILNLEHIERNNVDYLYIGTDSGLFRAKPAAAGSTQALTAITEFASTTGERIEVIAAGPAYTACVTALNLFIIDDSGSTPKIKRIGFNEGLPATGLLNGDEGLTDLKWKDASTLVVSGANGVAQISVAF